MIYLSEFTFPTENDEYNFFMQNENPCFSSYYPFGVLRRMEPVVLKFAPLTILYGGNGSGKTTMLNVIAEAIGAARSAAYNRSSFFEDYLSFCSFRIDSTLPENRRIVTSDDVFDYMLNLRALNEGIDLKREEIFTQYMNAKHKGKKITAVDADPLSLQYDAKRLTRSKFTQKYLGTNEREHSNGETAIRYFYDLLCEQGLFLLDEPENSLSPKRQQELAVMLSSQVRLGSQLIISTHSPFLLAMENAVVYDIDNGIVQRRWTELPGVRAYYDFFLKHADEF
ncbi:MAG: AAA family ATPase [Oscillospiraceae bacterium]